MLQTLHQTCIVPPTHQVTLTLPETIPTGEVELVVVIQRKPLPPQKVSREATLLKLVTLINQSQQLQSQREMKYPPVTRSLIGVLAGMDLEVVDYQRHLEDKYL